jgi:hypothetical protein
VVPDTVIADENGFFSFNGEYTVGSDTLYIEYAGHEGVANVGLGAIADCFCMSFCMVEPLEVVTVQVWDYLLDPEMAGSLSSYIYFCSQANEVNNAAAVTVVVPYGTPVSSVPDLGRRTVLYGAYPNPFNPRTTIAFELTQQTVVNLFVFDVAGRLIRVLLDGEAVAKGRREIAWDGRDDSGQWVAAGVYFCRLDAGEYSETRRMALVK